MQVVDHVLLVVMGVRGVRVVVGSACGKSSTEDVIARVFASHKASTKMLHHAARGLRHRKRTRGKCVALSGVTRCILLTPLPSLMWSSLHFLSETLKKLIQKKTTANFSLGR